MRERDLRLRNDLHDTNQEDSALIYIHSCVQFIQFNSPTTPPHNPSTQPAISSTPSPPLPNNPSPSPLDFFLFPLHLPLLVPYHTYLSREAAPCLREEKEKETSRLGGFFLRSLGGFLAIYLIYLFTYLFTCLFT